VWPCEEAVCKGIGEEREGRRREKGEGKMDGGKERRRGRGWKKKGIEVSGSEVAKTEQRQEVKQENGGEGGDNRTLRNETGNREELNRSYGAMNQKRPQEKIEKQTNEFTPPSPATAPPWIGRCTYQGANKDQSVRSSGQVCGSVIK
jgi:hypothetical protein